MRIALEGAVRSRRLKTRDRLGLIRDVMAAAETGKLSTADGLEFTKYYGNETEYIVWMEIASGLARIRSLIADAAFLRAYDAFALNIFSPIYIRKKDHLEYKAQKSRTDALESACARQLRPLWRYEDHSARPQTLPQHNRNKKSRSAGSARHRLYDRRPVWRGKAEHAKLTTALPAPPHCTRKKNRLGRALGAFSQKDLLQKTLAFSVSAHVRPQDSVRMIAPVSVNPNGRELAWRFVKAHWSVFSLERYTGEPRSFVLAGTVRVGRIGAVGT